MARTTRRFAAFVGCLLLLGGCRSEPERSAVAQVPDAENATSRAVPTGTGRSGTPEVTLRRLWAGSDVNFYAQSISPDGRYLSMVDWSSFDLAVRDLRTEEIRLLTSVQNEEGQPWEVPGVTVFSRDGRRIVSSWETSSDFQLRVLDFEPDADGVPGSAESTTIFRNPELEPRYPFDWSPDGRHVVAHVYTAGKTSQLALISTADGTYRPLRSFDWREPNRAAFSPDGRYVAYDIPTEQGSEDRDVLVASVDGAYEARIVDGPAVDRLLGWHRSGDILFHSDRDGTPAVWRVPMSDGRPAGPAELVRAGMRGVEPLGFAGDGFYYGVHVDPRRLYLATVDFATGRLAGAPVPVDDPARIRIIGWDWSPDGKFLAYSGRRPGAPGSMIVIRSDHGEGEQVKSLHLDLSATRRIRYTPDGRSLIVFTDDARGRRGFYRVDLATGSYATIVRNDQLPQPTPRGDFDISAEGRTIWFFGEAAIDGAGSPWSLLAYDIESGVSRSITPAEWRVSGSRMGPVDTGIAVSPDGTRLAIVAPDTMSADPERWIGTIPVDGGPFTALAHLEHGRFTLGPQWTPDGRSLVFSTIQPEAPGGARWTTWIVPAEGGEVRPVELMEHLDARGMKLHPGGRRLAFLAGENRGEIWAMDGLWPEAAVEAAPDGSR